MGRRGEPRGLKWEGVVCMGGAIATSGKWLRAGAVPYSPLCPLPRAWHHTPPPPPPLADRVCWLNPRVSPCQSLHEAHPGPASGESERQLWGDGNASGPQETGPGRPPSSPRSVTGTNHLPLERVPHLSVSRGCCGLRTIFTPENPVIKQVLP